MSNVLLVFNVSKCESASYVTFCPDREFVFTFHFSSSHNHEAVVSFRLLKWALKLMFDVKRNSNNDAHWTCKHRMINNECTI